ncbi:hypothetical protein [Sphingomonas sp. PP-CE-1G-424]|uniref:hypothetical protein n=1 Tax=Sphingomonas sp. PP-CE-1G-424 TaxID=2135658 RepID=UPI001056406E|nr:hypothetical protein [Sphingomonas sp. PP-CE-1G-424]
MKDAPAMKAFLLCLIALTACGSTKDRSDVDLPTNAASPDAASSQPGKDTIRTSAVASKNLPAKYVKALSCDFDEKLTTAVQTYHKTEAGRAERARDVTLLKSLGFTREGRDGDLESVGGKIAAPSGLTVLGLPVRSVELNGMIGDANAMYVTVFDNGVTVNQAVNAARLQIDFQSYKKYKIRHYSRGLASNPYAQLYLDDRGGGNATLVCQIKGTPD